MPNAFRGFFIGRLRKAGNQMEKRHQNPTPRDEEYVFAYQLTHSQREAAEMCGVSRETVARACRRAGIALDGRKYNNGQKNGQLKITNEQLKEDARSLTCREIAVKYDMSEENVYKRARRLKIKIQYSGAGGHWYCRARRYGCKNFDKTITLKGLIKRDNGICQICGGAIDITAIDKGHALGDYPSLDHIIPLSRGGTHTWNNVQLAHMRCNSGKCDKVPANQTEGG